MYAGIYYMRHDGWISRGKYATEPELDLMRMRDLMTIVESTMNTSVTKEQVRAFAEQVEADLGLLTFEIHFDAADSVVLDMLRVAKDRRKEGLGSAALQRLCQFADQHGCRLMLSPAVADRETGTTSRARLVAFYKRFGFRENKGRKKDFSVSYGMIREPGKTPGSRA